MNTAQYILSILKSQLMIMWSWGFNAPKAINNGLQFRVQGYKHKGLVQVVYNEGADLFDVNLLMPDLKIKQQITGVYFDQLVEVIDQAVEHCGNQQQYEQQVKKTYSLL